MKQIKDFVKEYEPPKLFGNLAELDEINLNDLSIEQREDEFDGEVQTNYYTKIGDVEYRVPLSVLNSLKAIVEARPDINKVRVTKTGEGKKTRYTVIPME